MNSTALDTAPATLSVEPGTVFVSRWGSDQTNVDFFIVTHATAKSVWLHPVRAVKVTDDAHGMCSTVLPLTAEFTGTEFRRKLDYFNGRALVRIDSVSNARIWDGQRMNATSCA